MSNLVIMSIATSKRVLARQGQLLRVKVIESVAIQNVFDEARVSGSELNKVWYALQHLRKPHFDYIIRQLRCNNCFLEKLLVREGKLSDGVRELVVWEDVKFRFKG